MRVTPGCAKQRSVIVTHQVYRSYRLPTILAAQHLAESEAFTIGKLPTGSVSFGSARPPVAQKVAHRELYALVAQDSIGGG
jgi:hypothetical protein